MSEVVGCYVRIPIEGATVVLYLWQFGFAVVGVIVFHRAGEALEVVFTAFEFTTLFLWVCGDIDKGIYTRRRRTFLPVLMEMFVWSGTAWSIADNLHFLKVVKEGTERCAFDVICRTPVNGSNVGLMGIILSLVLMAYKTVYQDLSSEEWVFVIVEQRDSIVIALIPLVVNQVKEIDAIDQLVTLPLSVWTSFCSDIDLRNPFRSIDVFLKLSGLWVSYQL